MNLAGISPVLRYRLLRAAAAALALGFLLWSLIQLGLLVRQPQRETPGPNAMASLDHLRESMSRELERVALEGDFAEGGPAAAARLDRMLKVFQRGSQDLDPTLISRAREWMSLIPNARRDLLADMTEARRRRMEERARTNYGLALMEVQKAAAQMRRPSSETSEVERSSHILDLTLCSLFGFLVLVFLAVPLPNAGHRPREAESWNKIAVERSTDGILAVDAGSTIKRCNPAAMRLLGYSGHEILGQQLHSLVPASVLHAGDPVQVSARRRDGSHVPVRAAVYRLAKNYPLAAIIVLREWKQDEPEVELFAEDFGQPVTVINGYCDLLLESLSPDDPIVEDLQAIRRAGSRAADLVSGLREGKSFTASAG